MQRVYAFILFCRNHRKDCFDEPAARFRLDEKANLSVDHPFPKLALGLVVCRFNPLRSTKFLKFRERVPEFVGGFTVFNLQSARKPDRITLMRRMFRPHLGGLAILVLERIDSGIVRINRRNRWN